MEEAMRVRAEIQQIALAHRRRYGYRRITAELRRRGLRINHKRVARLMREDTLLAVQPRAFVVTTEAQHDLEVYRNLASRLTLTGINQLWVAEITYIRLRTEFGYVAVLLDGYARKVVGWALENTLATRLPLAALHQAITARHPPPGVVHHADRGGQYASAEYVQILQAPPDDPEHEPASEPLRQRQLREFSQTVEAGGDLRQPVSRSRAPAQEHGGLHRAGR